MGNYFHRGLLVASLRKESFYRSTEATEPTNASLSINSVERLNDKHSIWRHLKCKRLSTHWSWITIKTDLTFYGIHISSSSKASKQGGAFSAWEFPHWRRTLTVVKIDHKVKKGFSILQQSVWNWNRTLISKEEAIENNIPCFGHIPLAIPLNV